MKLEFISIRVGARLGSKPISDGKARLELARLRKFTARAITNLRPFGHNALVVARILDARALIMYAQQYVCIFNVAQTFLK